MCIFREFNKLILPGIKFSVLIRNMAPPQGEWGGGGGGGAFAPNAPSWIRHWYGYQEIPQDTTLLSTHHVYTCS